MSVRVDSYHHRGGEPPLLGDTIAGHFRRISRRFAHREAVVDVPRGVRLTYAGLRREVTHLARGLMAMGVEKGDRVGILSTNNIPWLLLQLATAYVGAILVNINPAYREKELAYVLNKARIQWLFTIPAFRHSHYEQMLLALLPGLRQPGQHCLGEPAFPSLKRVVIYNPDDPHHSVAQAPGFYTWQQVWALADTVTVKSLSQRLQTLDRDDPINIQFTSGTTGFPKAVVLSHHNIINNAYFSARAMHFGPEDRLCVPVPFYHCFGMVLANLLCLSVGACIVIACEHFDAGAVLWALQSERCTAIHGVPTMFTGILEHPQFSTYDFSKLRTGIMAGAPCPEVLMHNVMGKMGCREILIGYGETEASPLTHLTTRDDSIERRTQTVGSNLPHQEVKIVDPQSGVTLPVGQSGEICFRGYHIMRGYYADEAATREVIDGEGWLHSGDLGAMDGDGYVRITGRLKEMIIRGGENIYPREIEECLYRHEKIAEVAVCGVPDDYYGEKVMAWILLHQGAEADEQEIKQYCRENLAHFKVPEYIFFVHEFPMTITGKIQKYRMREIAMEKGMV